MEIVFFYIFEKPRKLVVFKNAIFKKFFTIYWILHILVLKYYLQFSKIHEKNIWKQTFFSDFFKFPCFFFQFLILKFFKNFMIVLISMKKKNEKKIFINITESKYVKFSHFSTEFMRKSLISSDSFWAVWQSLNSGKWHFFSFSRTYKPHPSSNFSSSSDKQWL